MLFQFSEINLFQLHLGEYTSTAVQDHASSAALKNNSIFEIVVSVSLRIYQYEKGQGPKANKCREK